MEHAAPVQGKPKRTGLVVVIIVVVIAVLAFAGWRVVVAQQEAAQFEHDYGACGVIVVAQATGELGDVFDRYTDVLTLAEATGRGALSPVVSDMQDLKQEADRVDTPACLEAAQADLVLSMDAAINGFISFMAQDKQSVINAHFAAATTSLSSYTDEIVRVNACAPDC